MFKGEDEVAVAAEVAVEQKEEPSRLWTWLTLSLAVAAAAAARKLVEGGWRLATGKQPPEDPSDPDVQTREAVAWAIMTAVAIGVARLFAQRKMAGYFQDSLGRRPPESDPTPRKLNQLRG